MASDPLEAGGPELTVAVGRMREDWRAEEEEWSRAAAAQWAHGRRLVDVVRELMHRGDTIAVRAAGATFNGEVIHVGLDVARLRTASGVVDLHLAALTTGAGDRHVRLLAPVMVRITERARSGGRASGGGPETFRACLLEHETEATEVVVGFLLDDQARAHWRSGGTISAAALAMGERRISRSAGSRG